ncbi:putative holin-like toxin [Lentibacillus salinarum]|uniref:Holin-like toxin n=1 Tax=Lentibacillus salinarum TaxID=446820 RepID=A0ABW3ZW05_9BACI
MITLYDSIMFMISFGSLLIAVIALIVLIIKKESPTCENGNGLGDYSHSFHRNFLRCSSSKLRHTTVRVLYSIMFSSRPGELW